MFAKSTLLIVIGTLFLGEFASAGSYIAPCPKSLPSMDWQAIVDVLPEHRVAYLQESISEPVVVEGKLHKLARTNLPTGNSLEFYQATGRVGDSGETLLLLFTFKRTLDNTCVLQDLVPYN